MDETPLLEPDLSPCAMFNFVNLKTIANDEGGHTAILRYVTEQGIFAETTDEMDALSDLKNAAIEYNKLHERFMCIHLKTTTSAPGQLSIGVHGFFSQISDQSLLEHWKLRISMSFLGFEGGRLQFQSLLNADVSLAHVRSKMPRLSQQVIATTNCIGDERFIEVMTHYRASEVANILAKHAAPGIKLNGLIKAVLVNERTIKCQQSFWQKMNDRSFNSDFELRANNGAVFPCHKLILSAHSTVLSQMVQKDWKEAKTNMAEIPDIAEEVVRSFLDFLYRRDVKTPMESCVMALDLLRLGHQYHVDTLEEAMKNILLAKPNDWFSAEMTLQLFLFSKNVEAFQEVKEKAVEVLQSKSDGMSKSELYLDFVKQKPEDALELMECCFACWPFKKRK